MELNTYNINITEKYTFQKGEHEHGRKETES